MRLLLHFLGLTKNKTYYFFPVQYLQFHFATKSHYMDVVLTQIFNKESERITDIFMVKLGKSKPREKMTHGREPGLRVFCNDGFCLPMQLGSWDTQVVMSFN